MFHNGDSTKGEIQILKQNKIFTNKYVDIYNDSVRFPAGNVGTYIRITSGTNKSVAILPITPNGNIVLIKNYRHGIRGWGLEVPKGAVDSGESLESAAKRELEEETGFQCDTLIHIGEYSESPAIFSSKMDCFIALNCQPSGKLNRENTEAIDKVLEMSLHDFIERKYQADFIDAISELLVYQYYFKKGSCDQ